MKTLTLTNGSTKRAWELTDSQFREFEMMFEECELMITSFNASEWTLSEVNVENSKQKEGNEMTKIINGDFTTVGELIEKLQKMPKDYAITPFGSPDLSFAIVDEEKRVYLDESDYIFDNYSTENK